MTISTVDILRAARDLYAQAPSHAPQGTYPRPGTFCVLNATRAAAGSLVDSWSVDDVLRRVVNTSDLMGWNAEHSTEEVLAAFDRAIEAEALKVAS